MNHSDTNLAKHKRHSKGFSLVELLVAVGIMGIMMAGFAAMQSNQYKDIRGVSEQLAALSLQNTLLSALADGKVCSTMLTNPSPRVFNSQASTSTIDLSSIPIAPGSAVNVAAVGGLASPMSQTLKITKIQITDFTQDTANANQYIANLHVSFNAPPEITRSLKDIVLPILLTVDGGGTPSATVSTCRSSGGNGSPNFLATWVSSATLGSSGVYQDPASGNVGIGTTAPATALDITGSLRVGSSGIVGGNGCGTNPEGSFAYDASNHSPVFCNNVAKWTAFGMSNSLLAENGYQVFPNGLILQWGRISTGSTYNNHLQTMSFPMAFPHQAFSITVTAGQQGNGSGDKQSQWGGKIINPSQFQYYAQYENGGGTYDLYWMATGY